MIITCSTQTTKLSLSANLHPNTPLVLTLEPFNGHHQIELHAELDKDAKIIATHNTTNPEIATAPAYYNNFFELHRQAIFLLIQTGPLWTALLCLSHNGLLASLNPKHSNLALDVISVSPHHSNIARPALIGLQGLEPHKILDTIFTLAFKYSQTPGRLANEKPSYPQWLNNLGWDSKIAYGKDISHDKILNAAQSLKKANFLPHYVLINDGWQQLSNHLKNSNSLPSLLSFEADKAKFPQGIAGIVKDLQEIGVQNVGFSHSMMGAPGGLHPSLALSYQITPDKKGSYFLGEALGITYKFYYDYYFYLRQQGVTFVEVCDQTSPHRFCSDHVDLSALYQNLQIALQSSACFHFNNVLLQRTRLCNENLLYWSRSQLAYSSNDTDLKCTSSAMRFIRTTLTTSLWLQRLLEPHYGPWPSNTAHSETLAMLIALSGSLNINGDRPDEHNTSLLSKVILPSGKIIKADAPLTLCNDSITANPLKEKQLYKAHTYHGENLIIMALNLLTSSKGSLKGHVSPIDTGNPTYDEYAAFSYRHGFLGTLNSQSSLPVKVKHYQADIITFTPIKQGVAILGCYLYFIASVPLTDVKLTEDSLHISSMITAPLLLYSRRQIMEVRREGHAIPWEYDEERQILSIDTRCHLENHPTTYSIFFE
ncbi:MAG: Sip1-related alpha-galactosidase [Chlamydiota bacterium]